MMNDDLRGALQRVNDRVAELLKNAQGARRGERHFTPEDIRQPRETMDALALRNPTSCDAASRNLASRSICTNRT